ECIKRNIQGTVNSLSPPSQKKKSFAIAKAPTSCFLPGDARKMFFNFPSVFSLSVMYIYVSFC
ncbi:hypothetical protein PCYB_082680, partial [Plasmodium cynomolgi strain B]